MTSNLVTAGFKDGNAADLFKTANHAWRVSFKR
jgi:hypothetical protein